MHNHLNGCTKLNGEYNYRAVDLKSTANLCGRLWLYERKIMYFLQSHNVVLWLRSMVWKYGWHRSERDVNWPSRLWDLTPLNYFLWGYVKLVAYADKSAKMYAFETNIARVIDDIRLKMLEKSSLKLHFWNALLKYQPQCPRCLKSLINVNAMNIKVFWLKFKFFVFNFRISNSVGLKKHEANVRGWNLV